MYLKLIACEVAVREFSWAIAHSANQVIPEFLPLGYHNDVDAGRNIIQERIDASDDEPYEAVLLGYALCNNMLAGVEARSKPLIIARAHDCITWFLGSKERYAREFTEHPGSYYYTSGWLSARRPMSQAAQPGGDGSQSSGGSTGIGGRTWEQLVEQYGEDNAAYLWEIEHSWIRHYTHGTYIRFPFDTHLPLEQLVREICERNGWQYGEREGDPKYFLRWVDGPWERDDYLIVKPGERISPAFDNRIIGIDRLTSQATEETDE